MRVLSSMCFPSWPVKNCKCGEGGPWIPRNKRGGVVEGAPRAERLFWAVKDSAVKGRGLLHFPFGCMCVFPCFIRCVALAAWHLSFAPLLPYLAPRDQNTLVNATVSPELPNLLCQRRIGLCSTQKTLRASDRATIHRVKGVCPWSPLQGGGGGWKRGSKGPWLHSFNFSMPILCC